jgi:glucosamine 6-phosphate synthetase-like amidotransferase/phosphosugar isomerase protein
MCGIVGVLLGDHNHHPPFKQHQQQQHATDSSDNKKVTSEDHGEDTCVAAAELFEALGVLQHRGQDAAGIATCASKGRMFQCKGPGLVRDVFARGDVIRSHLRGYMGVAHGTFNSKANKSTTWPSCAIFTNL